MQTFYNQAILSHNNIVRTSNIVTGIITEVITVSKYSTKDTYTHGDEITYVVSIANSGTTAINGLTLNDNLGAYDFGTETRIPLDYVEGTLLYYVNGVLQASPTVVSENGLIISPINIPAGGNAMLIYTVEVNAFAPLGVPTGVTNTVTVSGNALVSEVIATRTITPSTGADLAIVKALNPSTVMEGGLLTYTLTIQNYGPTPVVATENAVVQDTLNPILKNLTVTFNGEVWSNPENYTYNEATGQFSTVEGNITVPAASYVQDPVSGAWTVTPGVSIITISGNV